MWRHCEERHHQFWSVIDTRGDRQGDEGERASRCVGGDWIDIECVSGGKLCAACEIEGAKVVIVNAEPTEMDDIADVVVRGSIGEILPQLFAPSSNT